MSEWALVGIGLVLGAAMVALGLVMTRSASPKFGKPCFCCFKILSLDETRHFKECPKRADFPVASTSPCAICRGTGRI